MVFKYITMYVAYTMDHNYEDSSNLYISGSQPSLGHRIIDLQGM